LSERREVLLRAVEDGMSVVVDVSGVTRIDTAGLQLLLAFAFDMRRQGRVVMWSGVPSALREGARLAGITALLGI
jgi:ABC-type transporter Mla MlaB component